MNKEYYTNNEVRIGEDYITSQPHYYTSLRSAFYSYFDTYIDNKDSVVSLASYEWKREGIGFNFNLKYDNIVTTILDFHRFFELLIKDILSRVDPYLSVKVDSSSRDYVKYVLNGLPSTELRTVEYGEARNRLRELLKIIDGKPGISGFKSFEFLLDGNSGLEELTWWRNRITHNGSRLPNILSFDYLISQKVIPLVIKVIEAEMEISGNQYEPFYFTTASGIEVVQEIAKIKFEQDELTASKGGVTSKNAARKFIKLYLLKGLGRASLNYQKPLKINATMYVEYHRLQHRDSHQLVRFQEKMPEYYKTNRCLCCSNKTLVTFKEEFHNQLEGIIMDLVWAHCMVCDYGVSNKIGNPIKYGLTKDNIFE